VQDNNQTNQQNQQNLSNNSEIFQKSVTLLTKEMAIKKQQEQIQFLEALLLQQTLENQEMEHKLNSLFKSSQKIFTSEHNFVEKLREIEPLCENIEQNIQSDFKLQ
jgi:predicted RNase H-like nuclease (RuvC/YqgF family)